MKEDGAQNTKGWIFADLSAELEICGDLWRERSVEISGELREGRSFKIFAERATVKHACWLHLC